ncbi:MAG: carbon-nitrogen hydrolase [Candidatus Nitronauta litoralis]|uniref:Carbon-nitrogen hydrolase n=1 Tax=Candidatus Nitronauta litoralis TaxID=2705533 RepID=A0A7T0G1X5_9BACT|nr:MAG: carbon-nitrogen hydrolase [Candidatus Nitronauta litoralis]
MPNHEITSTVNVGLIQRKDLDSLDKNLEETIDNIHQAAEAGANIVCLQELYKTPYFCQTEDTKRFELAETIPGPSTEAFTRIAKAKDIVIIAPLFEKRSAGVYHNTAVVIDADGTLAGRYRKMHIPDDPCFYEKFYFTPGDLGFQAFDTKYGKIGVLICWDQWFPEAARLTALSGADILFYPTAIGFQEEDRPVADKQRQAWETIQRSHAIANGVFVASTNRVGKEGSITFWGQSFMCDPFGEVLARASEEDPEVLIATFDLNLIEDTRQGWPFLRDRRVDAYSGLNQILLDTP